MIDARTKFLDRAASVLAKDTANGVSHPERFKTFSTNELRVVKLKALRK